MCISLLESSPAIPWSFACELTPFFSTGSTLCHVSSHKMHLFGGNVGRWSLHEKALSDVVVLQSLGYFKFLYIYVSIRTKQRTKLQIHVGRKMGGRMGKDKEWWKPPTSFLGWHRLLPSELNTSVVKIVVW